MMIRSLRQLLKAYWKELTKAQIKQKKSRLLIYDEHLKRFVSADELLIPNETFKINKVGGPISKRKSKDLLYDLLLKKFVNTKLDIYSSGGMEDRPFSKLHSPWKNFEGISSYNRDLFWGKKYSGKKNRVPALPPVNGQPPTKEEETTKTGWAGQRTINPETDPRPELRSSSDCCVGPGKRPDKKKPPRKKNDTKRLIVCAEKKHKITEKEPINSSLTWKALPETETSARNTIYKPKDHVKHSNISVIKSQACNKDNVMKSIVLLNENDSELSVGSTNLCFGKTSEMVKARELHSEDESPEKPKEHKCNKCIYAQTKNPNVECMKNNKQRAPDIQLNCETFGKIKDQAGKVSDKVSCEPIKTCASKDVSGNSKICDKITKEHQNSKTTLSTQISQKQTVLRKLPNITKFDSNYSKDVNKNIKLYKGILPKKTKPLPLQNDDVTKCVSRYNKEVSKSIMLYKGKSSDFELNCETKRKFKELSGKPSDKVIHESTNVCSSREKDNCLECSYKDENLQNNSTKCVSSCNKDVSKQFVLCKGDSPEIGLNCENKEHIIKQQPGKANDQVMPKDETTNICASSKEGTGFNVAIGECNRSFKNVTTEQQNIKVGQSCSNKNSPEQTILPDLPTVTKCSSSCNKDVNKSTTTELCNTSKINKTLRQNTHQQAHSKYVPSKATKCYSNTQLNKDDNNSICSSVKSKCPQEIKKCQVVSPKKRCSPREKEAKKTTSTCRSDSNVNFNSSTHPDGKVCEATKCSEVNKTLSRPKCTGFPLTSSTIANSLDCKSTKVKPKPSRTYCPSQPDLSNSGTCSCKEDKKFSRTTLRKGLEFGLKRPRTEPTRTTCSADESNLNDKTKGTMTDNKQADKESREVDLNCCKDEKIQSIRGKGSISLPQSEKCSVSSRKSKTKKNKTKKSQSGNKKKGCKKDYKSGLKEKKLCKESTKEMSSKQEHNCNNITQMDNSKPSTSREKQMVKRNKHKLQTINKLSSNMSSRHSKEILKKCKQSINVKSRTKENDNSSTSLSHKDTKNKESLCKTKRLENGTEINLKKEDQLLKTNQSCTSCKNKPDKKDIPANKQESRTTLKQTQSTMTAKICSQRCSRKTKSEVLLKPNQKKEDNKFIVDESCKARSKGLSKTVTKIKSSTKCNICSIKNDSNPENKQITQPGNSKPTNKDNMKNTLNSKALSSASHKLKKQEIRHFSAFKLHSEFKELAIRSNPKKIPTFNTTKSEISSYMNIRSSKENMEVNTTGLRKVLNQTNVKKSSSYEGERSLQKSSIHASVVTKKIVPPKNITIKPSCNTKEPNVVSIEANTANHDLPESRENQFYSNLKKNPVFTKCISNSRNQKRKEDSKSATVKPSVSNHVANQNKSSTILYLGNSAATTLEKGYNNVGDKNQSGSKNYTISSSKKQTQTNENCHSNHKGDILKKINSELPNGVKKIIRNKTHKDVGRSINSINKKQSKKPLQYSEKYLTEDNVSPEQVLVRPLEMLCTGVQDFGEKNVKINQKPKNLARRNPLIQKALPILTSENPSNKAIKKDILPKIDQKLKNLVRRNPLIKKALSIVQCENPSNKAIEKDILPYISQVCSDGVSKAPQKSKKTETAPTKHPKVRCLLKNNVPFKDAHIIDNHLQTKIKQDSQNSNCHCPKAIKSTKVRHLTMRRKVCVLKKSNTYTVLSSKAEKDNDVTKNKALSSIVQKNKIVPKIKTFTVQASKIQKKNIPKSKTFTVIPRKSYKADEQRVMCTIQKSDV